MKLRYPVLSSIVAAACFLSSGRPASAGSLVFFQTTLGDMEVELFDQDKPITTGNFLRYALSGRYRDSFFHRCPVSAQSGVTDFVIQGGGMYVTNRQTQPLLDFVPVFPPITNEFDVGPSLSNTYGTIAMAKTSDPNSATSQFFFNLGNNSASLDDPANSGGFTVFGRVIRGTNVLNQFLGRYYNWGVVNLSGVHPVMAELPVNYYGYKPSITFDDLIYVNVTPLAASISRTNNGSAITWQSVAGKMNYVEVATNLPPSWRVLWSGLGSGLPATLADTNPPTPVRFYRTRVDY